MRSRRSRLLHAVPGAVALLVGLGLARAGAAQPLAGVRIELAPGGNAARLDSLTLAAGDTLRLYAAGYDQQNRFTANVVVAWASLPAGLELAPVRGTSTRLRALAAGEYRVVARHDSGLTDTTGSVRVVPGPAAALAAFATPPGGSPPLAALDVSADSSLVLYAGAVDVGGNVLGPTGVAWSLDVPSLGALVPALGPFTVLEARRAGSGAVRLRATGFPDRLLPLTVRPGRLASLRLGLDPLGNAALGDTTLPMGAALDVYASGFDADANRLEVAPAVDWSLTSPIGTWDPAHAPSTRLVATAPGSARLLASAGTLQATSGILSVEPGPLARLALSRSASEVVAVADSSIDADARFELFALGFDASGFGLGPVAATWTSTDTTILQPQRPSGDRVDIEAGRIGTARLVIAAAGAAPDTSGALTVTPGRYAVLRVESRPDGTGTRVGAVTLSADSSLTLHAVGRDADGNFTGLRPVGWGATAPIGTLVDVQPGSVVLEATRPGIALVTAADLLRFDAAGPVTVIAGAPSRVRIEDAAGALGARLLQPGDSLAARAVLRDADGNLLGDAAATWSWIGDELAPLPAAPAARFAFAATRVGRGRLVATEASASPDTSGWIQVAAGALARLEIQDADGVAVVARTLSADTTLALRAVGWDEAGNALGEVPVAWSVLSLGGTAGLETGFGAQTRLDPVRRGGVRVVALQSGGLQAATDTLLVVPGTAARLGIETAADGQGVAVGARALQAGDALGLFAVGRDADGNFVARQPVAWSASGDIGTLAPSAGDSTQFVAVRPGRGVVRAEHAELAAAETGELQVSAGSLAQLQIRTASGMPTAARSLSTDSTLALFAHAQDVFGNDLGPVAVAWTVVPDSASLRLEPAAGTGTLLLPRRCEAVTVVATHAGGARAETDTLTVVAGSAARLAIETSGDGGGVPIDTRTLTAGERLAMFAVARDRADNFVARRGAAWTLQGDFGALETSAGDSTVLEARRLGSGLVQAESAGLPVARTGLLQGIAAAPARLVLERTPGDPADGLGASTWTADDSLQLHAVLRDSLDNWIAAAPVAWSMDVEPDAALLEPAADSTSAWFRPRHPGTALVRGTWNGLEATSGALSLVPGAAAGPSPLGAAPESLRADGASRSRLAFGPLFDRFANPVADGTRVEFTLQGATFAPGQDADPAAAGMQRPTQGGVAEVEIVAPATPGVATLMAASGTAAGGRDVPVLAPVALQIVPGSLRPSDVRRADSLAARLRVVHFESGPLRVEAATLRFEDGNGTRFEAALAAPESLAAGLETELGFAPQPVPAGMHLGAYTPQVEMSGRDALGHAFELSFDTGPASLRITELRIAAVQVARPQLVRHDTLRVEVDCSVATSGLVLDTAGTGLSFEPAAGWSARLAWPPDGTPLPADRWTRLQFDVTADSTALLGATRLDAALQVRGAYDVLHAQGADSTCSVTLVDGARAQLLGRTPEQLTAGAPVAFEALLGNPGDGNVLLDAARCLLRAPAAGVAVGLDPSGDTVLEAGAASRLRFHPVPWPPAAIGTYVLQLELHGTQAAGAWSAVLDLPAVTVQAPADLRPRAGSLAPQQVAAGSQPRLRLQVHNQGGSVARLDAGTRLSIADRGAGLEAPVDIEPDSLRELFFAPLDLSALALGPHALQLELRGTQNGAALVQDAALADTLVVAAPAALALVDLVPSRARHSAGATRPWSLGAGLVNAGGLEVELDSLRVRCWRAEHDVSAEYAIRLPQVFADSTRRVGPGQRADLELLVERTGTTLGDVRIDLFARLHEVATGKVLDWISTEGGGAARVRIESPAAPRLVAIEPSQMVVASGQAAPAGAWTADVVVVNDGGAELRLAAWSAVALVDSVDRTSEFRLRLPPAFVASGSDLLAGGERDTLRLHVDSTGTTSGRLRLRIQLHGLDDLAGAALAPVELESPDMALQPAGVLHASGLQASAARVTAGSQRPWELVARLENQGGAELQVDGLDAALRLFLDGVDRSLDFAPRATPAAARLAAGASLEVRWDITATPELFGLVHAELRARGLESASGRWQETAAAADGPRLEHPADLRVVQLLPPRTSRGGPVHFALVVANAGEAAAALDTTSALQLGGGWRQGLGAAASLAGGDTLALDLPPAALPMDLELGPHAATWLARGTQNGDPLRQDVEAGTVLIDERADLELLEVVPSQDEVVTDQAGPDGAWFADLVVDNAGGADLELVGLDLEPWVDGSLRGSEFGIDKPAVFAGSGTPQIAAGGRDTLRFTIAKSGSTAGTLRLQARLRMRDPRSGAVLPEASLEAPPVRLVAPAQLAAGAWTASRPRVLAGGTAPWSMAIELRNDGGAQVDLADLGGALRLFVDGIDRTAALAPVATPAAATLAGGARLQLEYRVAPTPALFGEVRAELLLEGLETASRRRLTLAATGAGPRLEAGAALSVVEVAPQRASRGGPVNFVVQLTNHGAATAELDSTSAMRLGDWRLPIAAAAVVAGGDTLQVPLQAAVVPDSQPLGPTPATFEARGTQDGEVLRADLAADSVVVESPASLVILAVVPSQPTVTRLQVRPWRIDVVVRNAGDAPYRIETAAVALFVGGVDRTSTYQIALQKTASTPLAVAGLDTLRFLVTATGPDLGLATLEASVRAIDENSGRRVEANTFLGGKGSLRVQAPALPRLAAPRLSQPAVTAGQTRPIEVVVELRNDGEAQLRVDTDSLQAAIRTEPPVPVQVLPLDGGAGLGAGQAMQLRAALGPFAVPAGTLQVHAAPRLVEPNRDAVLPAAAAETLAVQPPAAIAVAGTEAPAVRTHGPSSPWTARLALRNAGGSAARLVAPRLVLRRAGVDRSAAFGVQPPAGFDDGADLDLPAGAQRSLTFLVTGTDTLPGDFELQLAADAVETNSGRQVAVDPGAPHGLRLERPPGVAVIDSTLAPRRVSRGQSVALVLRARHTGEAPLALAAERCWVRLGAAAFEARLAAPVVLAAGAEVELRFAPALVGDDVPLGLQALDLHFEGTHHDNPWSLEVSTAPLLQVEAPAQLEITAVRASQGLVTAGQERPWSVRVAVRNHGAAAALESAGLTLTLGAEDIGAGFEIEAPAGFESGTATLAPGATDTLGFVVRRTLDVAGLVVLDATVRARDLNSGALLHATSQGTARGSVRLAPRAQPLVAVIEASQARVSAGQRGAWTVRAVVRNDGGSPWRADWTTAGLQVGAADDSIVVPAAFAGGVTDVLQPGGSAEAWFVVAGTGLETGSLPLQVQLSGIQDTDGARLDAAAGATAQVLAQAPAQAELVGMTAVLPRAPLARLGQSVPFEIQLANVGGADLSRVALRLECAAAAPADTMLVLALPAGQSTVLRPRLRLVATGAARVRVHGAAAVDANDSTRTDAWAAPPAAALDLAVLMPGVLAVTASPSQARVSAGQESDWWLTLQVANTGQEPLVVQAPRPADVEFLLLGAPQADYVVEAPVGFETGGLELAGGAQSALRYRVLRTGSAGGTVQLRATLRAAGGFDPEAPPVAAQAQAQIDVDGQPGLRVVSTESVTWRRLRGHDDFRVDAGQRFTVRVVVQNTGGTPLDSIRVSLESQRGNSIIEAPAAAASLAPGQQGEIDFAVTAGTLLSQPGLPESFVAHIVSARDRNSNLSVQPGAALDNTTFAYVEAPAVLELQAWIEAPVGARDGVLSAGQRFEVQVRADNLGQATVSESGRVRLEPPPGYAVVDGDPEVFFSAGAALRWTLQAPDGAAHDTLAVHLSAVPQDENSGEPAGLVRERVALPLQVLPPGSLTAELSVAGPTGALEGVVSAGQDVVVRVEVAAEGILVEPSAELALPAGWTVRDGAPLRRSLPAGPDASLEWRLGVGAGLGTATLGVQVEARDPNDASLRQTSAALGCTVVRAAQLALSAAVVAPDEATDGRVLPGQSFTLRARVRNLGEAGVLASPRAALRLTDVPAGCSVEATVRDLDLGAGGNGFADWQVVAPAAFRTEPLVFRAIFETLPHDAHAGSPAAVHPDSAQASCVMWLADERLLVEVEPEAARLAVPGERDVRLLQADIANPTTSPVSLDSLGLLVLVDGAPVSDARPLLRGLRWVRQDAADTLHVEVTAHNPLWTTFAAAGAKSASRLAAQTSARFTLQADFAPGAPARAVAVTLADPHGGVLVRAVESGSRTPIGVRAGPGAGVASNEVRVVEAALQAYNAPNPFHVGRETTAIHYRQDGAGAVRVRIFTLQGGLVWETERHEAASGPVLGRIDWDGRNGAGQLVRNGVYVCHVSTGTRTTTFKIAVVR